MKNTLFTLALLALFACQSAPKTDSTPEPEAENTLAETEEIAEEGGSTAFVLAESGITLRKTPSREGEKIITLKRGAQVEVLDMNGPEEVIEGMESPWIQVKTAKGMEGWMFGGFLGIRNRVPHCYCNAKSSYVLLDVDSEDDKHWEISQGANYSGKGKIPCFIDVGRYVTFQSIGYAISDNGNWIAADEGTDIMGSLVIANLETGKVVHQATWDRNGMNWKGNTFTYLESTGEAADPPPGEDCPTWVKMEEVVFEDGKVRRTGKFTPTQVN